MTADELRDEAERLLEAIDVAPQTKLIAARPLLERLALELGAEYRQWVNAERTELVTIWRSGHAQVARRETPAHIWGPPATVYLEER